MSTRQIKNQMKQLKEQLHASNRSHDIRLLKLAFVMVILAIIAAFMFGRIRLW